MRTAFAVLPLVIALLTGCNQRTSPPKGEGGDAPPVNAATAGSVSGTVTLTGTPPKPVQIDMGLDPACNLQSATDPNLSEQVVTAGGKLANVYVYIKSGLAPHTYPAPAEPLTIAQKGCRYLPHVAAARAGQLIRVLNDDMAMHNIHPAPTVPGNHEWNLSQLPGGAPIEKSFPSPEVMMPVKCNQHPWMKMYLNIAANPYFAVTGKDGSFTIPNLPPGDYLLAAVQEKYGEQDQQITVAPHQPAHVTFNFTAP